MDPLIAKSNHQVTSALRVEQLSNPETFSSLGFCNPTFFEAFFISWFSSSLSLNYSFFPVLSNLSNFKFCRAISQATFPQFYPVSLGNV